MDRTTPPTDGPVHVLIHGRVQGVGFRESMVREAVRLGARGWVRNRLDGTVEAVFDGTLEARTALLDWSRCGPALARVTRLDARAASAAEAGSIGARFVRVPSAG
jgi:acylphosphatase